MNIKMQTIRTEGGEDAISYTLTGVATPKQGAPDIALLEERIKEVLTNASAVINTEITVKELENAS